jgi:hypothetical protein
MEEAEVPVVVAEAHPCMPRNKQSTTTAHFWNPLLQEDNLEDKTCSRSAPMRKTTKARQ